MHILLLVTAFLDPVFVTRLPGLLWKVFRGGRTQGNSQQQLRSATLEQTSVWFYHSLLKGRCLRERYKHSVIHSANLQLTAKAMRLISPHPCIEGGVS